MTLKSDYFCVQWKFLTSLKDRNIMRKTRLKHNNLKISKIACTLTMKASMLLRSIGKSAVIFWASLNMSTIYQSCIIPFQLSPAGQHCPTAVGQTLENSVCEKLSKYLFTAALPYHDKTDRQNFVRIPIKHEVNVPH